MQDAEPTQQTPPGYFRQQASYDAPRRPLGLAGLVVSLAAMGVAAVAWFGILCGLVFAVAWLVDGAAGFNDLVENFERFEPRQLKSDGGAQRVFFAGGTLIYLAALLGVLTVARFVGKGSARDLLGWRGGWPSMTRTAWTLVALAPLYHLVAGATLRYLYPDFAMWLIAPSDFGALVLSFVMIVVLAPVVEELVFRGWIFGALRTRYSAATTVLATALLFALVHWDRTGLYPVAVLVPGYILSTIRERTGSTKAAVAAHAIYNFIGWALLMLAGLLG